MYDPYILTCVNVDICGRDDIDERIETVWSKVIGWEKKRDQGGTNHVALRQPVNEYMCDACMNLMRSDLNPAQTSLVL